MSAHRTHCAPGDTLVPTLCVGTHCLQRSKLLAVRTVFCSSSRGPMSLLVPFFHAHRHGAARGAPVTARRSCCSESCIATSPRELDEAHVGRAAAFRPRIGYAVQQQVARSRATPVDGHALRHVVCRRRRPRRAAQRIGADIELYAGSHDASRNGLRACDGRSSTFSWLTT